METKADIEAKADALKDSNPDEALILYRRIWDEFYDDFNGWNALNTFTCMSKISNPDMVWAIEIAGKFHSDRIRGKIGWLFFDKFIKSKDPEEIIQQEENIDKLLNVAPQKDLRSNDQYSCWTTVSIIRLVDAYAENLFNARKISEWLTKLKPEYLSLKTKTIKTERRGDVEIASDLEKYYAMLTKALLKLEKFEECKDLCENGLEKIKKFHYDNNLWFKMRIAVCEEKLGNAAESERLFKSLLATKAGSDKWFLYRDIAEVYFEQDEYDKAWKYAVDATFYGNEPHFMIGLYLLQARILFKLERPDDGKLLAQLICAIVKEQGWQNKDEYTRLFNYYDLNVDDIGQTKDYFKNACDFWANQRYGEIPVQEGEIISINHNGKGGKIKNSYGDRIAFLKRDFRSNPGNLQELKGAKVEFVVMEAFDGSEVAEYINVLEKKENTQNNPPEGAQLTGRIKRIVDYGMFISFDGYRDGLLHKNNLPKELNDLNEAFKEGDNIEVIIEKITDKGVQLKYVEK